MITNVVSLIVAVFNGPISTFDQYLSSRLYLKILYSIYNSEYAIYMCQASESDSRRIIGRALKIASGDLDPFCPTPYVPLLVSFVFVKQTHCNRGVGHVTCLNLGDAIIHFSTVHHV